MITLSVENVSISKGNDHQSYVYDLFSGYLLNMTSQHISGNKKTETIIYWPSKLPIECRDVIDIHY